MGPKIKYRSKYIGTLVLSLAAILTDYYFLEMFSMESAFVIFFSFIIILNLTLILMGSFKGKELLIWLVYLSFLGFTIFSAFILFIYFIGLGFTGFDRGERYFLYSITIVNFGLLYFTLVNCIERLKQDSKPKRLKE